MVKLTKIYTRTGDDGTTVIGNFDRTTKTDPRLVAYADVDETNTAIGVVLALAAADLPAGVTEVLQMIQHELFDVGADLCTPLTFTTDDEPSLRITDAYIEGLENLCDEFNADLPPLNSFVLPGGNAATALLHQARVVARRAERSIWAAIERYGTDGDGGINILTARYLNRLSDFLFVLARFTTDGSPVLWQPGALRQQPPNRK